MTSPQIVDGKALAEGIFSSLMHQASARFPRVACLATVLVGDNPASKIYIANKVKSAQRVGIKSLHHQLSTTCEEQELLHLIDTLNRDENVDGILVQLPLPPQIREHVVIERIDPDKDVDGFHPLNLGRLMCGLKGNVACTPLGVMHILHESGVTLSGKHAVVIGRSTIVGKPMAQLLLKEDATVTMCHSKTRDLAALTSQADILIAAVGKARMITATHVKPGAVVIDVGINRDSNGKLCGDVDFANVLPKASLISPVPGGVGPLTIAMLLKNTWGNFTGKFS